MRSRKRIGLWLLGTFFVIAGAGHFARPDVYVQIMPPALPWPRALVLVSGAFEILGGIGVLWGPTRRAAAWGLVALLVAVFPANVYMALHQVSVEGGPEFLADPSPAALWARLPIQGLLIAWAWWFTRNGPSDKKSSQDTERPRTDSRNPR